MADVQTTEELAQKLEQLGLPTTGSKAVLRKRLRRAKEGNGDNGDNGDDNRDGGESSQAADNAHKDVNVDAMKKEELRRRLAALGLSTFGLKAELRDRLRTALRTNASESDEDSDEDDEDSDVTNKVSGKPTTTEVRRRAGARESLTAVTIRNEEMIPERHYTGFSTLTFKDVEDSLGTFSGDGTQNVRRWLTLFEETAEMCRWADAQKVIYAKRQLRGSAKLFANFECHIQTWKDLKNSLAEEFGKTMNSRQVHKELSAVIYRVMEIASHADIELEAKIQYIIDGVNDEESYKSILYGATTIKELRQRFLLYETQRTNRGKIKQQSQTHTTGKKKVANQVPVDASSKRCFNCGDTKHLGKECPDKAKGQKCYSCNEFGHIAAKCPKGAKTNDKGAVSTKCNAVQTQDDKKTYKTVSILGKDTTAIIDPGSDLHLMRASFYAQLEAPRLQPKIIKFDGVGSSNQSTLGRFSADVTIDGIILNLSIDCGTGHYTGHHDLLIGGELSDLVEVRIRRRQASLSKLTDAADEVQDSNWAEVMCISVQQEESVEEELNISLQYVEEEVVRKQVQELVKEYRPEKTEDSGVKMHLVLRDEVPVHQNPRRLSMGQRGIVNQIVNDWTQRGIIRPSSSEYASPIVLVEKKNGEPRLCVDYRQLNKKIVRDRFPLPLIEDQLDKLAEAKLYCTLDLKDGFFHVPIEEGSIKYTSFVVPDGQFEFLVVPFGLCNSPAVFQRHIKAVFRELAAKDIVMIYLDDLIIPAKDESECVERLRRVLLTASRYGLRINWKKSNLLVRQVEYLGHTVKNGTIRPTDKKIQAVTRFPEPTTTKMVQSFLGLTGYFRKFVPLYATMARPLTQLLRDNAKFRFEVDQKDAFERLKRALTNDPVLKIYRLNAETELHTDASRYGLGAILLQRNNEDNLFHPVYYAS